MSKTIEVGGKTMHLQPDGTYKAGPPKEKATARAKALKKQAKDIIENRFAESCVKAGLPLPIAEHRFHPTRKWRIDYFFRRGDLKVALEVEGGVWTGGRHTRGAGFLKDIEKYNAAASEGIYLVRTTPDKLFTQGISDVLEVFKNQE